jgi:hypothetical protein
MSLRSRIDALFDQIKGAELWDGAGKDKDANLEALCDSLLGITNDNPGIRRLSVYHTLEGIAVDAARLLYSPWARESDPAMLRYRDEVREHLEHEFGVDE